MQLLGGMVLHRGMIAEMKTGEGKTLVATLPVYLNALTGKGVHVVTVNDYLAKRDAEWMGSIYRFLGLTVGCIVHGLTDPERREAYACDVTYGTNNEFGFDYLRDNMKFRLEDMVQRPFHYAIVDEVDSILIDEARTPLIISGPAEDSSELYIRIDRLIPHLADEDFEKDEKARTVTFTETGTEKMEELLRDDGLLTQGKLYDISNISLVHHANQALRAHKLFSRDIDYIVKDDKVIIIDEFTGRMMEGRRYSEGLHQALEAKEGVHGPAGEPDARLDHLPELLPPLSEAGRHDRHGDDRGRRVRRDLQAGSGRHPDQRAVHAPATTTTRSIGPPREKYEAIVEHDRGMPGRAASRCWSAPCRSRSPSMLSDAAEEEEGAAPGAERPLPRAGGGDHRPGRRQRRGDDRHQHGRARHRHPARRQCRHAHRGRN